MKDRAMFRRCQVRQVTEAGNFGSGWLGRLLGFPDNRRPLHSGVVIATREIFRQVIGFIAMRR